MSAGIDFFTKQKDIKIKVTNINDVTINKKYFNELIGLELPADLVYQAWYEDIGDGDKIPGMPVDTKQHFAIKFSDIKTAFETQKGSIPKIFEVFFSDMDEEDMNAPAHLISTTAEILQEV